MAKLEVEQRQVATPPAPDLAPAGQAYGAIAKGVNEASLAAGEYVQQINKLESSIIHSEYSNILNDAALEALQPANLINNEGGNAFERYAQSAAAIIQDAENNVPAGFKKNTKYQLEAIAANNALKVKSALLDDINAKQKATIESSINSNILGMKDALQSGNTFTATQYEKSAYDLIRQAKDSNYADDKDVAKVIELIDKTKIEAKYAKMGRDAANSRPGTVSKIQEYMSTNDEGMTPTQADWAINSFNKQAQTTEALKEGERKKRENEHKALLTQALFDIENAKNFGTYQDQEEARQKYFKLLEGAKEEEYIAPQDVTRLENEAQNALIEHRTKKEVERLQGELTKKESAIQQFRMGGHQEKADQLQHDANVILQRLQNLNAITENDKFKEQMHLREIDYKSRYFQRGINDANAEPGVVERQLIEFSQNGVIEPLMTEIEKINALNAYSEGVSFAEGLKQRQRALNYADVSNGIDSGSITNMGQVATHDLTALQYKQAESQLIQQATKQNAQATKVNNALRMIQAGGGQQDRLEPKEKEAAFQALANEFVKFRQQETGNPDYQLDRADMIHLYKQMNTDIPALTAQLNYAALEADPKTEGDLIQSAMATTRQLAAEAPNVLRKMDTKARSIATKVNSSAVQAQGVDIVNLIEKARVSVNPGDPEQQQRVKRFTSLSQKDINKLYKSILPGDPLKNTDTLGQFTNMLSIYNAEATSLEDAAESVRQVMQPVYGQDRFFEPNSAGYLPSKAAVPYSGVGQWYSNQVFLSLYGLTERHKNSDVAATEQLQWVYGDLKEDYSEKELMNNNLHLLHESSRTDVGIKSARIAANPLQARYRGQIVDVFYEADGMSRLGDNDRVKYVFYFKTPDGQKQYITDPKSKDGSGFFVEYPKPLEKFLPNQFNLLDNERADERIAQTYKAHRAATPGTRAGTKRELEEAKAKDIGEITKSFEQYKVEPLPKQEKKSKPNLVKKLLEEEPNA